MKMQKAVQDFIDQELAKRSANDFIYNEFSLQHELGFYLRRVLKESEGYKIQFERNVEDETLAWGKPKNEKWKKKEMDIYVYNTKNPKEKYAIELKYPKNGQYPEEMYSFVKDIKFMEQVKEVAGAATFVFVLVEDKNFYTKTKNDEKRLKENPKEKKIYDYFRAPQKPIPKEVPKPTGNKDDDSIKLNSQYPIEWRTIEKCTNYRYYFFEI